MRERLASVKIDKFEAGISERLALAPVIVIRIDRRYMVLGSLHIVGKEGDKGVNSSTTNVFVFEKMDDRGHVISRSCGMSELFGDFGAWREY